MCGEGCCNNNGAPLTASQMLDVTFMRFKGTVVALLLIVSFSLGWRIFHGISLSIPELAVTLVYILVLNIAMRAAITRNVKLLRFYWVYQLIQVILVLLVVLVALGFFVFVHVQRYRELAHPHPVDNMRSKSDIVEPTNGNHAHILIAAEKPEEPKATTMEATTMEAKVQVQQYKCPYTLHDLPYMIVPALVFLLVIFLKTRSIVLARQMISLIEATAAEQGDVEMDNKADCENKACCQHKASCETKACAKACCENGKCSSGDCAKAAPAAPAQNVPVAIYAPEAVYVMPSGFGESYPGQLMPVYVDKFGQH